MAKYTSDADTYKEYQFSKVPAPKEERSPYEIRMDSLTDALEECDKILTGARQAADPRNIPVYEMYKQDILKKIQYLKDNPDAHDI